MRVLSRRVFSTFPVELACALVCWSLELPLDAIIRLAYVSKRCQDPIASTALPALLQTRNAIEQERCDASP